jgi:DNA-binding transcriptional ArsR family regulator
MIDPASYRAAMHPVRLSILLACSRQPQRADALGLPGAAARWHLGILEEAGLVDCDDGRYRACADWRPLGAALEAIVTTGPRDTPAGTDG